MLRIVRWTIRFSGTTTPLSPLTVYADNANQTVYIDANDITRTMRASAARVYNLHPQKDAASLQLWSAHSYKVGAACILHGSGYTEAEIKFLLRWKSNTFMMYLRNLTILSRDHTRTLDRAAAVPNFVR
jgi:hypothetical protein